MTTYTPTSFEIAVHRAVVNYRKTQGIEYDLYFSDELGEIAREHSHNCIYHGKIDHVLNGKNVEGRLDDHHMRWTMCGENLLMGGVGISAQMIVNGWISSPGHRANLINTGFWYEGVGVAIGGSGIVATEVFCTSNMLRDHDISLIIEAFDLRRKNYVLFKRWYDIPLNVFEFLVDLSNVPLDMFETRPVVLVWGNAKQSPSSPPHPPPQIGGGDLEII